MGARKRRPAEGPFPEFSEADLRLGTALNAAILSRIAPPPGPKTPKGCRWIEGDVRRGDWRYCQQPQQPGSVLCCQHHGRAWFPPPRMKGKLP